MECRGGETYVPLPGTHNLALRVEFSATILQIIEDVLHLEYVTSHHASSTSQVGHANECMGSGGSQHDQSDEQPPVQPTMPGHVDERLLIIARRNPYATYTRYRRVW